MSDMYIWYVKISFWCLVLTLLGVLSGSAWAGGFEAARRLKRIEKQLGIHED